MKIFFCCSGLYLILLLSLGYGLEQNETSGIINVQGAKLHYIIQGTGTPCVVLGLPTIYIRIFSQKLRASFKFIFLSLRHDAQSENSMELGKITLDTYVDDINQARLTLGLDKIVVLGHSGHGMMALEYAHKYPQNTSHVIMMGTPPFMNQAFYKAGDEFWKNQASDERKMILKQNREKLTKDALSKMTPNGRFIKSVLANVPMAFYDPKYDFSWGFESYEYNIDVLNRVWGEVLTTYDVAKVLGQIATPVFLALGKSDYGVPYILWDNLKDKFPNLSYNLFEKSGHYPMLEEQPLFDRKLVDWIKSH
jgi:proline iminopeptidase